MKTIVHEKNTYVLRFDPGEEVLQTLSEFCEKENIKGGSFTAIGATKEVLLAYFNLESKKYEDHLLQEELEMLSVIGNISVLDGKVAIHAHGTFGDRKIQVRGGHIKSMNISVTCELTLQVFETAMERKTNQPMNVNLLV